MQRSHRKSVSSAPFLRGLKGYYCAIAVLSAASHVAYGQSTPPPRIFCFNYQFAPAGDSGRVWINTSPTHWLEVYADGTENRFTVTGPMMDKTSGEIAERMDNAMVAFIPDAAASNKTLMWRTQRGTTWYPLGQITEMSAVSGRTAGSTTTPNSPTAPVAPPPPQSNGGQSNGATGHLVH